MFERFGVRAHRSRALALAIFGAALLGLWSIFGIGLWTTREQTLTAALADAERVVELLAAHASRLLDASEIILITAGERVSRSPARGPDAGLELSSLASALQLSSKAIRGLAMLSQSGELREIAG